MRLWLSSPKDTITIVIQADLSSATMSMPTSRVISTLAKPLLDKHQSNGTKII